jgi:CRISPR-associated endonuclease Csn1
LCYFNKRDDLYKIEQFKKEITDIDIQGMTERQEAATKYAARQVMTYLADALYEGKGLPERSFGSELNSESRESRRIFATDGLWTSRLRREWGLFFDRHDGKAHGLTSEQQHERKEKNRGDHRHHAIDAIVIALCTEQLRRDWDARELRADKAGVNTADEDAMEKYREQHRLDPPAPFKNRQHLREAVSRAVFGEGSLETPVCHRPVKRKLIGAFHKATQYGAVVDSWVENQVVHREAVAGRVTVRQDIIGETKEDYLKPTHLRLPRPEKDDEAVERLARRLRIGKRVQSLEAAIKAARKLVMSRAFTRKIVDPKPEKGGIVRDLGLRRLLRRRLEERGLNPDSYTNSELKQSIKSHGPLTQDSGVPIHRVILLWSNNDPVTIRRDHYDYATGQRRKLDDPGSLRLYDGQNNHHIEIRTFKNNKGHDVWTGEVVTGFEAAQRKLAILRAFRQAGIPKLKILRNLPRAERAKFKADLHRIEKAHPIVDRADNDKQRGGFVMSLCEGEMLLMKHKVTGVVGYFEPASNPQPAPCSVR